MRHLPAILLACGVLAASAAGTRCALAQDECVGRDRVAAAIAAAGAFVRHEFVGADALAWLDLYNAVPPRTHIVGDQVVIADRSNAPMALVIVLTEGCVSAAWQEGRGLADRLADQALGGGV